MPESFSRIEQAARHAVPHLRGRSATFPEANLRLLRETGRLGLLVPAEHGGMGGDLADLVHVAREFAGPACRLP